MKNKPAYTFIRELIDKTIAFLVLLLLAPLFVCVALLIMTDHGPIFFRQERLGKNALRFRVFKFRTMVVNADNYLGVDGEPTGNRITKIGGFLRKSSIDELPQLINVLNGDMALIGPRPILPSMAPHMHISEKRRFEVKPGITGLAQVKGRNWLKWSKRFRYDKFYVENMGFKLDFYIVVQTFRVVIMGEGISMDRNAAKVDDVTIRLT